MATYIANKPCCFAGKAYLIGEKISADKISADKILPRRVGSLLRMGVIIKGEDEKVLNVQKTEAVSGEAKEKIKK